MIEFDEVPRRQLCPSCIRPTHRQAGRRDISYRKVCHVVGGFRRIRRTQLRKVVEVDIVRPFGMVDERIPIVLDRLNVIIPRYFPCIGRIVFVPLQKLVHILRGFVKRVQRVTVQMIERPVITVDTVVANGHIQKCAGKIPFVGWTGLKDNMPVRIGPDLAGQIGRSRRNHDPFGVITAHIVRMYLIDGKKMVLVGIFWQACKAGIVCARHPALTP